MPVNWVSQDHALSLWNLKCDIKDSMVLSQPTYQWGLEGRSMKQLNVSAKQLLGQRRVGGALPCLVLWLFFCAGGLGQTTNTETGTASPSFPATHVLGLAGTRPNTPGSLTVRDGSLRFEDKKQGITLLSTTSIEAVLLSQQDKQVGGVPMTLGKAAVPFGGGRVVSLFSHKKYDDIALIYRDDDGGVHGAIIQLPAGQGTKLRDELVSQGARVGPDADPANGKAVPEVSDATN